MSSRIVVQLVAIVLLLALAGCGNSTPSSPTVSTPTSSTPTTFPASAVLPIPGVFQQTSEWCWAAVSEMALRYFNEPNLNPFGNYQCGVIGVAGKIGVLPPFCQFDCTSCIVPISSAANLTIVLQRYPLEVQSAGLGGRSISATAGGVLSFQQVESSIVAGHPVVAGVTPIGIPSPLGPAHATLIVGFDTTTSTRQGIYVNDPFPYGLGPLGPYGDPYLLNGARFTGLGQYLIDYSTFLARLSWTEGIVIQ